MSRTNLNTSTPNILLVGTYCGLNKGDRLMQLVMAENLIQQVPNAKITLASPFPDIDKTLYRDLSVTKSYRRNLPLSLIKLAALILAGNRFRASLAKHDKELKQFLEADLIIDLSGDMLTEDYGVHVAFSHALPLIYSRLLNCRYYVIAQSIGPFRYLKRLYKWLLNGAAMITTRDKITYDYLDSMTIDNKRNVADLGFLLSPYPSISPAPEIGASNESLKIGVSPSRLLLNKFNHSKDKEKSIRDFAAVLDQIATKHNGEIVFAPHVMSPKGDGDDTLCIALSQLMATPCSVIDPGHPPNEVKAAIANLDIMIAFRMHAAIAAIDCAVPTIGVAYSHKMQGLMNKFDLAEWVIDNSSDMLNELKVKTDQLLEKKTEVISNIESKLPGIRDEAKLNISILLEGVSRVA